MSWDDDKALVDRSFTYQWGEKHQHGENSECRSCFDGGAQCNLCRVSVFFVYDFTVTDAQLLVIDWRENWGRRQKRHQTSRMLLATHICSVLYAYTCALWVRVHWHHHSAAIRSSLRRFSCMQQTCLFAHHPTAYNAGFQWSMNSFFLDLLTESCSLSIYETNWIYQKLNEPL